MLILTQSGLVPVVVSMENISLAGRWKRGGAEGRLEVIICTGSNPTNPHRMDQSSCQWSSLPGQPKGVPTHQGQITPTGIVPVTLMDPQGPLVWVATDSNVHPHRTSSWIIPTF